MGHFYERGLRPLLFTWDAERAHERAVHAMSLLGKIRPLCALLEGFHQLDPQAFRPIELFGLKFPNAVGLAAGFDKNAQAWPAAAALGFGHVEIGTVTALQQPGNPKPRMFRYPGDEAVINRMGFNNDGADQVAQRLSQQAPFGNRRIPLGINLGKSKAAALDKAVTDYLASFSKLADFADYLVLNVSSPNTPDLRRLQDEDRLRELLGVITTANRERFAQLNKPKKPVLLKIAPDLTYPQIDAVLATIAHFGLDGIIATNTTLARPTPFDSISEAGGLSGKPLQRRSTEIIRYIARSTEGKLPIIGVGGIHDPASAAEKLDAGASLIQIYSGMIFRGPFFAADLARGLSDRQAKAWGGTKK